MIWVNIIILITMGFLFNYIKKKGENQATKEDIDEITDKIEKIKHDYNRSLEQFKISNDAKLHIYQARYEKEFDILMKLSKTLIPYKNAILSLRPIFDSIDPNEQEDERRKKRLNNLWEKYETFYNESIVLKPFFSGEIYQEIIKLENILKKEVIGYKHEDKEDTKKYWDAASENALKINEITDKILDLIHERIVKWETFEVKSK